MDPHAARALLLFQQDRNDLAVVELRQGITSNPDDSYSHALLSLCLGNLGKLKDAEGEAREAIRLAPGESFPHYCLAHAYLKLERYKPAEQAALEAVELDPWSPTNLATLGHIRLQVANWKGALEAATMGLSLQGDHVECANVRSLALRKLGRNEEAALAIDSALSVEPDNANTHANKGWALLEAGNSKGALEHFREALRLDPGNNWARQGTISALKARNPLYRILFAYFVWMSRLNKQSRYFVILGLWFIARFVIPGISNRMPAARPVGDVLIGLYLVFCFTTWTADPLMNTALRFDKFGKYLLTRKQIVGSTWVAASFLIAIASFIVWLFHHRDGLLFMGIGYLFVTYLVAVTVKASTRSAGVVLGILTGIVAIVATALAFL